MGLSEQMRADMSEKCPMPQEGLGRQPFLSAKILGFETPAIDRSQPVGPAAEFKGLDI
jgi:hypothetical protein